MRQGSIVWSSDSDEVREAVLWTEKQATRRVGPVPEYFAYRKDTGRWDRSSSHDEGGDGLPMHLNPVLARLKGAVHTLCG
jgi:hypothetical protein